MVKGSVIPTGVERAAGVGSADGKTPSMWPIPTERGCGENSEQPICVGWRGRVHVPAGPLCSTLYPASVACMLLPKPWQVGLPWSHDGTASVSSPLGCSQFPQQVASALRQKPVILVPQKQWPFLCPLQHQNKQA